MEYVNLGRTGLKVSRLCIGMTCSARPVRCSICPAWAREGDRRLRLTADDRAVVLPRRAVAGANRRAGRVSRPRSPACSTKPKGSALWRSA